jgi:tripartite-type tricarboxylate transporter receptor subunit TctC
MNLRKTIAAAAPVLALLCAVPVHGQTGPYPNRPLRIIVPHAPGNSPDVVARVMGEKLARELGQPVVIENKAGAGGLIGAEAAAASPGDGYTLFFTVKAVVAIVPNVYNSPKYNPVSDFKAISQIATVPHVLTAAPNAPFSTMKEMVDYAKAHPGQVNYGSTGIGTQPHVAMEVWQKTLGIKLHHIPYKANPTFDLMRGVITLYLEGGAAAVPTVRAGRVKGLAVSGSTRLPGLPNVPAANEYQADLDSDGIVSGSYHAFFAPKATPDEIVARLNRELVKIVAQPETQTRLRDLGLTPTGSSAAELAANMVRDYNYWQGVVKELNIKAE